MNDRTSSIRRLLDDVFATQADEIQCDEAQVLMARCADVLLSDEKSQQQYPLLWLHFRFCPDCAGQYQMLMDMAHAEAAGLIPNTPAPARPDINIRSLGQQVEEIISRVFSGFPAPVMAAVRGGEAPAEPVTIELASGLLSVTFNLSADPDAPAHRILDAQLWTEDESLQDSLGGIWSGILPDDDRLPQVKQTDDLGAVSFSLLAKGDYTFYIWWQKKEYRLEKLEIL